jgi:hypothetical protein
MADHENGCDYRHDSVEPCNQRLAALERVAEAAAKVLRLDDGGWNWSGRDIQDEVERMRTSLDELGLAHRWEPVNRHSTSTQDENP